MDFYDRLIKVILIGLIWVLMATIVIMVTVLVMSKQSDQTRVSRPTYVGADTCLKSKTSQTGDHQTLLGFESVC